MAGGGALTGALSPAATLDPAAACRRVAHRDDLDAFDQQCLVLRQHGLAMWASGSWQLTRQGWLVLTHHDPTAA